MLENHMVIGDWDVPGWDCAEVARCATCNELPPIHGADECEHCLLSFYQANPDEIDECYPTGEPWNRIKAQVLQ